MRVSGSAGSWRASRWRLTVPDPESPGQLPQGSGSAVHGLRNADSDDRRCLTPN